MAKQTDQQKIKRLLAEYLRTQIALSWIGTEQDDDARSEIQSRAARAENALDKFIKEKFSD